MKHIIVLSDAHGLFHPEVLEHLYQTDVVIHGSDINTMTIVEKLSAYP